MRKFEKVSTAGGEECEEIHDKTDFYPRRVVFQKMVKSTILRDVRILPKVSMSTVTSVTT